MRNLVLAGAVAAMIAGCGGGGGGASSPAAQAPTEQLATYIGNWASACYSHAIDSATISRTPGTSDSITISYKTDYYANANCTGNIIGTWSQSASATAVYAGTVDSSIVFTQGSAAVPVKVDKVTASLPQHTATVTGTGVVHTVNNGQAQWCMNFGDGSSTCINDTSTYPAQSGVAGGLYLQGNVLYELTPSGSLYTVNEAFNKQ